jgi:hypothetical protein
VKKVELTDMQNAAANVSGDAIITAVDALMVLQYSLDKMEAFPVQK